MKTRLKLLITALLIVTAVSSAMAQGEQPKVSADEQKMAQAVLALPDPTGRLKSAADFVKKYPKSSLRVQVARGLVNQIGDVTDAGQKVNLAQAFQGIFTDAAELDMIMPVLLEALGQAKRPDEAFAKGSEFLAKNPDSLLALIQLLSIGTDEAKIKNTKFVDQSLQYGTHAIQLIETDKKPSAMDAASWPKFKSNVLPSLYQSIGLLSLIKGDRAKARASYGKASELAPSDPFNYLMLGAVLDQEYNDTAKRYQSMPAGPAKDAERGKVLAAMDAVIDAHAHMLALSEGNQTLQEARKQVLQDFETYYKYRHNNSTDGMQQLIDKYKVAPKP